MIAIIDYGAGNLGNVKRAFDYLNIRAEIVSTPAHLSGAKGAVLPGVGAFASGMAGLKKRNLVTPLKEFVREGHPFLGICLGMQLLFEGSFEDLEAEGLGIFSGRCRKFSHREVIKVPHMGWNSLAFNKEDKLIRDLPDSYLYFVHSFYVPIKKEILLASCQYGDNKFMAAVKKNNIWGFQPHPEKSGSTGLKILANFAEVVKRC